MNCKGMLRPAAFENDVQRDRLDKPPEHFILTYLVTSLLHDFRRSMNRRGKTTRNGEFPNLHHENNFMCTCIAITQTALERKGRLALDRRGKHAGRDREGWNPRKPTIGILGDPDFAKFSSYSIIFSKPHFAFQYFFKCYRTSLT